MPLPRGKRWVFTLNNYTADEVTLVTTTFDSDAVRYGIFGREVGESGTPHLQGFIIWHEKVSARAAKRALGGNRVHVELARGTSQQARDYCKKEGDFVEIGDFPDSAGKRTDLDAFFEWGKEFIADHGRAPSSPECAIAQPKAYTKYPRACKALFHQAPAVHWEENPTLRPWQQALNDELNNEPDDRSVLFYVDEDGNNGKTWFCRYLMATKKDEVQILSVGKRDDLAHMIDQSKRIFLFNVPRTQMQYFQYSVLEQLKDGMVQSNKYSSCMKMFTHKVHVVVFCNEFPDAAKMTADRMILRSDF